MYLLNYIKSTNPIAQVWSVHHSGHTYPTRLHLVHLQSKLNWVSCIFHAAILRWQHAPGCTVVTAPLDLKHLTRAKVKSRSNDSNQGGPGWSDQTPTPKEQPPPWVLLVLCPIKALLGLSCWRLRAPALKGNVSSPQNSLIKKVQLFSHSVVVHSLGSHGLSPTRLLCPWDSPGKDTGVGCHSLLQGIFPTQGSKLHLLHWQVGSLSLGPPGKPLNWYPLVLFTQEYIDELPVLKII